MFKCVASLQKGPHVAKIKNEILVDLNRAGSSTNIYEVMVDLRTT